MARQAKPRGHSRIPYFPCHSYGSHITLSHGHSALGLLLLSKLLVSASLQPLPIVQKHACSGSVSTADQGFSPSRSQALIEAIRVAVRGYSNRLSAHLKLGWILLCMESA